MEKIAREALAQLREELKKQDRETIERRAKIPDIEKGRHRGEEMANIHKQREAIEKHAATFTDEETAQALAQLREEVEQKTQAVEGRGWLSHSWGIYPTPETMEELDKLRAVYFSGLPLGEALEQLKERTREGVQRLQKAGQDRQSEQIRRNGEELAQLLKEHEARTKQEGGNV